MIMKIIHLLYSGLGGHGHVFFSLVKADKDKVFETEAVFNGIEEMQEEYKGLCRQYNIKYDFVKKRPGPDLGYYFKLAKKIRHADPEIIFLHASSNIIAARLALFFGRSKKKIIVRETQANELKTRKEWFWLRLSLLFADKIVFLSDVYKEQVKMRFNRIYRPEKISVIPNGIDLNLFRPGEKKKNSVIVLGMVSRIVVIKDQLTLIQAFGLLKHQFPLQNFKLRIAGAGENSLALEEKARQLGIGDDIEFTGPLGALELLNFLQSLDIYIHASFGETMSTAIMQAMACRKTVIASDVTGINNMIQHGHTGWLVPVQDPVALSSAIGMLVKDQELAARLADKGWRFAVDNYSSTEMFNRYKQLFFS